MVEQGTSIPISFGSSAHDDRRIGISVERSMSTSDLDDRSGITCGPGCRGQSLRARRCPRPDPFRAISSGGSTLKSGPSTLPSLSSKTNVACPSISSFSDSPSTFLLPSLVLRLTSRTKSVAVYPRRHRYPRSKHRASHGCHGLQLCSPRLRRHRGPSPLASRALR